MSFRKDRYAKRTLREQKRANRIAITFGVLTILTAGIGLALGQRHAVSQNGTEDQPPSNGSDGDLAFTISPWVDREGLFGQKRLVSSKELKDAIETSPSGLEELCYAAGGGEAELMSREVRLGGDW